MDDCLEFTFCDPDTLDRYRRSIARHLARRNKQASITTRGANIMYQFAIYVSGRKVGTVWSDTTDEATVRASLGNEYGPNATVRREPHTRRRYPY